MNKAILSFLLLNMSNYIFATEVVSNGGMVAPSGLYLDYAASWEVNNESLDEFVKVSKMYGNSSGVNSHAHYLRMLEERATHTIAAKIKAMPYQIHFVSGASVANNIAILGVAYKNPKCHLITTKIEHKGVLKVFEHLKHMGYEVTYLNVDKYGRIKLSELKNSIKENTKLISIQMFNSEIGMIQDVQAIGKIANEHGILFHTDAAQSFCKYDIDVEAMHIDLLTMSGHKIAAPKGIGALYVRNEANLEPIMFGSGDVFFPGTKSTALICAFGKAVEKFHMDQAKIAQNYRVFSDELSKIGGIFFNSSVPSHVISVSIADVALPELLNKMQNNYSFSSGCSCSSLNGSNVIRAIDPENKLPNCTIRISFSDKISEEQLVGFAKNLKQVVEELRANKMNNALNQSITGVEKMLASEKH